ncbi:CAAX protease self-immunity [Actinobacteria bacterium IMCC26207]|nr:CAAX protease self-immunity [Actinobacteria bacterium IMCC26207]
MIEFNQNDLPVPEEDLRWGLGDVAIGIFASLFLSVLIGGTIMALAGWGSSADTPIWGLALLQIPLWAGYLGAVVFAGSKGRGVITDFGLRMRALDAPLGLALGVFCQLLVLPLLYAPIFFLTGSDKEALSRPAEQLAEGTDGTFSWLLFALLVGILAPVVEELFYRGLLLKALEKRRMPVWVAVLVSSIIFAGMHMQTLQFPGLLLVGLMAGTLAALTGRLGPSIWLHIGFNMTTVVALFMAMRS